MAKVATSAGLGAKMFEALKQHPVAAALSATTVIISAMEWTYSQRTQAVLLATMQQLKAESMEVSAQCTARLKELDSNWNHDMRKKDQLIRRLQMQNIEQMRSVDRLNESLSQCDAPMLSYANTYASYKVEDGYAPVPVVREQVVSLGKQQTGDGANSGGVAQELPKDQAAPQGTTSASDGQVEAPAK
jgi:hypothetical protein